MDPRFLFGAPEATQARRQWAPGRAKSARLRRFGNPHRLGHPERQRLQRGDDRRLRLATRVGRQQRPYHVSGIVDDAGLPVGVPGGGYLVLTRPWPSMLRGIWGDPQRYRDTYWSRFGDKYFAGDGAKRDDEGYYWLLGRVDDIMLVAGHNISTTEVESALVDHPSVAEAAVVGRVDATTGQAIAAFVTLRGGVEPRDTAARRRERTRTR